MELEKLGRVAQREVRHVLMVDHFTWWQHGRSYFCRIIDMLHMGYLDEVPFCREVLARLPQITREWRTAFNAAGGPHRQG